MSRGNKNWPLVEFAHLCGREMKLGMSGLTKDFVMMPKCLGWRFVKVVFARGLALCFHCPF
jgi:hypothetical protein